MDEFFISLKAIEKVFLICAVLGGFLFIGRMILMLFGYGHHGDADGAMGGHIDTHHGDIDHSDSDVGFKFISLQGLTAFFMMFGLVGLAFSKQSQFGETVSVIGAVVAGVLSVWIIAKLMSGLSRLQSEGNLDPRNAIGQEGVVYLTIPATGQGVVQIVVQQSLRELNAVSQDKIEIKTGERVVVESVLGNLLVVKKL